MTNNEITEFTKVRNPEDEIFIKCMTQIKEFPQYITKYDDIEGPCDSRYISNSSYRNLNLDSVRLRKNGSAINIEHHSSINQYLMQRNYEYAINIFNATGRQVHPFIFYTGDLPVKKIIYMNEYNFFSPQWFILKEKDGMKRLNNIRYKHQYKSELNASEILDYAWLPKFDTNMTIQECIMELAKLSIDLPVNEYNLNFCKECVVLWAGKYITDIEQLNYINRCLNMSKLELVSFEEQLKGVILNKKLTQAEERGEARGEARGVELNKTEFISKALKRMSPQEVSAMFEIPIEDVLRVKNLSSK